MDRFRLSLIVIGTLAVAVLFGGWALGVQPQLDRMANASAQTAAFAQTNAAQQQRNAELAADNEHLGQYKSQLAASEAEVPSSRSQQGLVDQLNAAAGAAGVTVSSLVFTQPVAYVPPAGVPVELPGSGTLVAVPLTIAVNGARPNLEAFAAAVQSSTRTVSITGSQYSGPEDASLTLTGTTWVLLPQS